MFTKCLLYAQTSLIEYSKTLTEYLSDTQKMITLFKKFLEYSNDVQNTQMVKIAHRKFINSRNIP